MRFHRVFHSLFFMAIFLAMTGVAYAQQGKLKVHLTPKQGYVFVDGNAIGDGSRTVELAPGEHHLVVVNYGFKMFTDTVNITAGNTTTLNVTLNPSGDPVKGPWGRIQIEGQPRAAVLLNGKTPDYFVGHVDEFNNDIWWKQELLVPPGTFQVTVTRAGQVVWAGPVTVQADQRVIVDLNKNGAQRTTPWPRGAKKFGDRPIPRFKAGVASATIAVAKPTGSFSASKTQIDCGQSSTLNWTSTDTVDANISGIGTVPTSGNRDVTPHKTTTYDFSSTGPGGTVTGSAEVNVNTTAEAQLSLAPTELRFRRIGDKVLEHGSATLTWSTHNADAANIDPFGKVDLSGSRTIDGTPKQTGLGPVDETESFTLHATNVCGGSATQSASLHIVGSIEPIPEVRLASIFFPTDYPDAKHPDAGLLKSQQQELSDLAAGFKKYLEYDPGATLSLDAHADIRASNRYNMTLSERRADRIKQFLVEQGIAADKVAIHASGEETQLSRADVASLEQQNPQTPPPRRLRAKRTDWLAYNRRVDIALLPANKESAKFYPHAAPDSAVLWQLPKPRLRAVEQNQ
jgi:outer membrane protein OmpA-like peptidoglycan-associated protein